MFQRHRADGFFNKLLVSSLLPIRSKGSVSIFHLVSLCSLSTMSPLWFWHP